MLAGKRAGLCTCATAQRQSKPAQESGDVGNQNTGGASKAAVVRKRYYTQPVIAQGRMQAQIIQKRRMGKYLNKDIHGLFGSATAIGRLSKEGQLAENVVYNQLWAD